MEVQRRYQPRGDWPTGHIGWSFAGLPEFEGRAGSFLAEGTTHGERLMFVADDPRPELWPKALLADGTLVVLSTADVYGPEGLVDAGAQRATFEHAVADALADGFTGLRVAADNTSVTAGPERLAAWMRWEREADRLMQVRPITGVCAFDRTRVDRDTLRTVMGVHTAGPPHHQPVADRELDGDGARGRGQGRGRTNGRSPA